MNAKEELDLFIENCDYDNISEVKKALDNHFLEDNGVHFVEEFIDVGHEFESIIITKSWRLVKNRLKRNGNFVEAIISNDEKTVQKYIRANNIDINYYYIDENLDDHRPILCTVSSYEKDFVININILKMLLNSKQKIDQTLLQTALNYAVALNSFEAVTLLLDYGANINHVSNYDDSALSTAIDHENVEMVKFLLRHGAETSLELNNHASCAGIELETLKYVLLGLIKPARNKYPSEGQLYKYLEYNVGLGKILKNRQINVLVKEYFLETTAEMNHKLIKKFKLNVFDDTGSADDIFISKLLFSMDNYFLADELAWTGNENLYDIDDVTYRFGTVEEYKMLLLTNKEKIISSKNNFFGDWMEYDKTPLEVTLFTSIVNITGMSDALRDASSFDGRNGMSCMFNIFLSLLELNTLSRYSLTLEGIKISRNR